MVGSGTALADDPLLTARPAGARTAARIVVDSQARLPLTSQLVQTAHEAPVVVAVASDAPIEKVAALAKAGCEVLLCPGASATERLAALLAELGRRQLTNVLVEGGGQLLGSLFDAGQIDEVHVFIAPKLVGGSTAPGPIGGDGKGLMAAAVSLVDPAIEQVGTDIYVHGRLSR